MDTKKLFEYETNLESLKPQLSETEIMATLKNSENLTDEEAKQIASFTIAPGADGVYIKFTDSEGKHQKLQFMNPVIAKALAASLMQNLSLQGYTDQAVIEDSAVDSQTIH